MVTVANRRDLPGDWYRDERYVYIGRPGRFGNPFPARNLPGQRQKSVSAYREWLMWKLGNDELFAQDFYAIPADAVLVCHCAPLLCHGDVMADLLNSRTATLRRQMELKEALAPKPALLVKLGSLLVHYQEMSQPGGHVFDKHAIDALEADPEVRDWFETMTKGAFLPVKRSAG